MDSETLRVGDVGYSSCVSSRTPDRKRRASFNVKRMNFAKLLFDLGQEMHRVKIKQEFICCPLTFPRQRRQ